MRAKQSWEVRLVFVEEEGQDTSVPWYTREDIVSLIRTTLAHGHVSTLRDLTLQSINASPEGSIYY